MARVYSFWIFDRHCNAIYHQDWSHLHAVAASAAGAGGPLSPTLSQTSGFASLGASIQRATTSAPSMPASSEAPLPPQRPGEPSLPNVTRATSSTWAATQQLQQQQQSSKNASTTARSGMEQTGATTAMMDASASELLPFDQEAKLVYGVVFSLRNMVRKLGGE